MSLRLRLLVAVGLIAIVALVVADFATYSALRSSLYNQVDQQLAQRQPHVVRRLRPDLSTTAACLETQSRRRRKPDRTTEAAHGTSGARRRWSGGGGFPNIFGISYIRGRERRAAPWSTALECPAYVDDHPYRPQLPGADHRILDPARRVAGGLLHAGSIDPDGPSFRVRAEKVDTDSLAVTAVQAQPLVDQNSTLHTLFLTELAVTAGALVLALAGGWWLVRLGSASARGRGAHRRLHRGG